jgi:hypothetical protein
MRLSHRLCLALLLSASVAGAQTQTSATKTDDAKPAPAPTTAGKTVAPAGKTVAPAGKTAAPAGKTAAPATKNASVAKKPVKRAPTATKKPAVKGAVPAGAKPETRTLQDIHIEGEIPVPQVLFITARDQRRFVDFQHQRYLKTSQEVGLQTALPSRLVVTGSPQTDPTKENRP